MEFEFKTVKVGMVVTGEVFKVTDDGVYVDVQSFTEAVIYKPGLGLSNSDTCVDHYKVGDSLTAKVTRVDYDNQSILLSRQDMIKDDKRKEFDEFATASNQFEARVKKVVRGGLVLNYKGIELFMPASQIDTKRVELEDFANQTLKVVVIENDGRKVVVSRRKVLEQEFYAAKKAELETFKAGETVTGTVMKIGERGVNVKLGHNFAFIHISEISHFHVKDINEFLTEGQEIEAQIIGIDKKGIKLSLKRLQKAPWDIFAEEFKVGDKVTGKIVRKMGNAMLVEVSRDVVGIINEKDYSWDPRTNLAGDVEVGTELELQIISLDAKKKKMSLSKKHLDYNPWNDVSVKLNETVSGEVEELQSRGALVKIQGVKAFLPIGEITSRHITDVKEVLSLGQAVTAVVTTLDKRNWKMVISIKQLQETKERKEFEQYKETEQEVSKETLGDFFAEKFKEFK